MQQQETNKMEVKSETIGEPIKDSFLPKERSTLTKIVSESAYLVEQIIENGGELTPELEEVLELNNIVLAGKMDAYGYFWERLDVEEEYWKAKAQEFDRIAKSVKKVRESLKHRIKFAMGEIKKTELAGEDFRFKLAKTSGRVSIDDVSLIPNELKDQQITWVPRKDLIKAKLKAGEEVQGASLSLEPSLRKYPNKKAITGSKK